MKVGNIGAHLERDIDPIVEVDPDKAQLPIGLVETLVRETHIARDARQTQMGDLVALAQAKKQAKQPAPAPIAAPKSSP